MARLHGLVLLRALIAHHMALPVHDPMRDFTTYEIGPAMSDDTQCYEVPFTEQLRGVPKDFRTSREIQWATDGTPTGHQFIPVGFMFHRAADEIDRLTSCISETVNERDELRAQLTPPTMTPEEEAESLELENTRHEREQERSYDAGYNAGWAAASREYAGDE